MTEYFDVTRRLMEEAGKSMDDVETHKMGGNKTGGYPSEYGDRTPFIDDIDRHNTPKVTDVINNNGQASSKNDERTRIFRPNQTIETDRLDSVKPNEATQTDHMSDPVVGWVVIVAGPGKGAALPLGYGMNTIGRTNCRVTLNFGDTQVSREPHANITYDPRGRCYYVNHGGGKNLTYINDSPVLQSMQIRGGEVINLGETFLKFVPFCGAEFDWQDSN